MDQRYSAIDAIAHLGKTFQSIDCRALVVNQKADEKDKDGNQLEAWMSVFLVIRFSHTPVEMVQAKYRDLIGEFTDIRTKRFRIIAEAFAFDKWDAIADSLATGRMVLQGVTFSLKKSIQPAELSGQPWKHPTYVRSEYRPQFPCLELFGGGSSQQELFDNKLQREVSELGFDNPTDLVNLFCEIDVSHGSGLPYDFFIHIPFLAPMWV